MNKWFLLPIVFFTACAGPVSHELQEKDVVRYMVFCDKLKSNIHQLDPKAVMNDACVIETDKISSELKTFFKQNGYKDRETFTLTAKKVLDILLVSDPKLYGKKNEYLSDSSPSTYNMRYTPDELDVVSKHEKALKSLIW